MWSDADSDEKGHGDDYGAEHDSPMYDEWWELNDARAYWRRRFLILCGGLVALGACAWLIPGPHQPSKREAAAASASMSALAERQSLPPGAHGPAWPAPSTMPNVYPTAPAKLADSARPADPAKSTPPAKSTVPAKKPSTDYQPKPAASASRSDAKAGKCAPASIVLSMFTSKPGYAKGAHPSFSVYAVSTSTADCTLTYGAGSVQVVVTQHGRVVWDSTACKPTPAQSVSFTLGVPHVVTLVWNPSVAKPAGCAGSLPAGAAGTLDAVAISHGQSSPVRSFKFGG